MRLVDTIRDPSQFAAPPPKKVTQLRQSEYEALPERPFFVGVPADVLDAAKGSGRVGMVARGRQGLATAEDQRFLAGIGAPFRGLDRVVSRADLVKRVTNDERKEGIPAGRPHWVPFAKGEGFSDYWREPRVAIDWSRESVMELKRRDGLPAGTSRKPRFQNRSFYFTPGLTYSVVASGRVTARQMPEGWIFGHKGSAIFVEDESLPEPFLLGYLNSALATYFMKRIVNTTATADIGYVEKLPFRRPDTFTQELVTSRVETIVERLKADPDADVGVLRSEIDEAILDLFEIRDSREAVLRYYETVGRAERAEGAQAPAE